MSVFSPAPGIECDLARTPSKRVNTRRGERADVAAF